MSTLTIEDTTLGKTMSTSGTLVATPSAIPFMQGCNTKSCSSSRVRLPYVIWQRRQHLSQRKSILKKHELLEHMRRCGGVGWIGWSSWDTQEVAQRSVTGRPRAATEGQARGGACPNEAKIAVKRRPAPLASGGDVVKTGVFT